MKKILKLFIFPIGFAGLILLSMTSRAESTRWENAKALGWIEDNSACHGRFRDRDDSVLGKTILPLTSAPTRITANSGQLAYSGLSLLSGNVLLEQPGRMINANTVHLMTKEGQYKTADFEGNVVLREKNKMVIAKKIKLNIEKKYYSMRDILYRLNINNFTALSAWGTAAEAIEPPANITELKNVTYSTCPPQSRAWELHAKHIYLDQKSGRGSAYNAFLVTHGTPIFYIPYISFPIDNHRQSGFLYPQFSFGGDSGFGLGLPYYWNMAPNYDDLITPSIYIKRGLLINNVFRYLTSQNKGEINFSVLPNDREFKRFQTTQPLLTPANTPGVNALQNASSTRSAIMLTDNSQWNSRWSSAINYNRVNDDYYLQDIGNVPTAAQNQLLQQGKVYYAGNDWDFMGNLQSYQTLHPINQALVLNQYSMLPQLTFTSRETSRINEISSAWTVEGVDFEEAPNPGDTVMPPAGQRINFAPQLILPLMNSKGYVTPSLQFEMTQYNVRNQPDHYADQLTRTVPITSIDSGLFFERDTQFCGNNYTETLEPRIFYLYVPYHNQNDIPVFDSSPQPLTYNQLFLTNRFSGLDRIGDANQISMGLTTRFFEKKTGDEKLSASMGVIDYFENREVNLPVSTINSTSSTAPTSPLVGQTRYYLNRNWSFSTDLSWDPNAAQMQNARINFQYMPAKNHIINLGYSYVRYGDFFLLPNQTLQNAQAILSKNSNQYNLSEPTVSVAWPLSDHWNLVGQWSYSWNEAHSLTYFSGLQYDTCCWAVQAVISRNYQGLDGFAHPQYSTGVFMQLALKGFSKFGSGDPSALLASGIPGYQS